MPRGIISIIRKTAGGKKVYCEFVGHLTFDSS
jgi:hypothetical protein